MITPPAFPRFRGKFIAATCALSGSLVLTPRMVWAEPVAELTISGASEEIAGASTYSGEGYIATTPNSGAAHRNAVVVFGGGTLTLDSGANVAVENDNNNTAFFRVGYFNDDDLAGGVGTFNINTGAILRVGQVSRYANFHVGEGAGNTGIVNHSGGDATVLGSFNVGVDGGEGTYTINGGTLTIDHADDGGHTSLANLGLNLNLAGEDAGTSHGELVINGGTVNVLAHEWDPVGHPGEYGSTALILGNRDRGVASYGEGNGEITQNDGVLHIDNHAGLYLSSVGNGLYNLNGGTLEIGGNSLRAKYGNGPGTYAFNLGGGTIKATGSALDTSVNATLVAATTSTIDTSEAGATWRGNLTGDGSLRKTGAEDLTLTGAANDFGVLDVQEGAVRVTTGSTGVTQLLVGATGTGADGRFEIEGGVVNVAGSADSDYYTTRIGAGEGNTGELLISDGTLNIGLPSTPTVRADFDVGSFSGTGSVTQTGGAVVFNSTNGGYFHIGNQGTGVYNLVDGTITTQNVFTLGRSTTTYGLGDGTLNMSGGTITLASETLGRIYLGGLDGADGADGGSGVINQTGGTIKVGAYIELGVRGGHGVYNLDGGTLEVGGSGIRPSTGTYEFNLGGGTIKVVGSDLTSGIDFNVVDHDESTAFTQSILDTNGLNAAFSGSLLGDGAFIKTGDGTLTLTGNNTLTGEAYVTGGGIAQAAGITAIDYLAVGSGAGTDGSYAFSSGELNISQALQVGDWGGAGTFDQTGGAVNVVGSLNIGNQGGTGEYNLSGGSFTIADGFANLGRSTQAGAAGDGVLNLSGTGLFEIGENGDLIIGDRDGTGLEGNGIVNQTGGTLRVAATGELWIGAYGNGTYNLDGGVLEVGGSSLRSGYGSGAGTSAFNLGGGTIKVVGSDLTTSVNANLGAGTADIGVASIIDTNGFNATWAGNFTGDQGGLIKTGAGNLNLTGNVVRTIGYLNADEGEIIQTTGTTNVAEFVVGSNYLATNGAYTLVDGTINLTGSTTAAPIPSFRVGDWGGTGVFNQEGGTINADGSVIVGNRAGTGTYNLTDGVLNIGENAPNTDASALILGRSRAGDGTALSQGTFNASGGTLHLFDDAPLLIGGDTFAIADSGNSVGVFNQSGTARVIVDSYVSLGAHGNGTYNLNGGTLEVGGANGIRKGTGAAAFNLGGGTIKVIGSALTTSVDTTLVAETTSTIDTNGLGATFSGSLTGAGGLEKTGEGELRFTGTSDYTGGTRVTAGVFRVDGVLQNTVITVGNGGTLAGHGTVADVHILAGGNLNLGGAPGVFIVAGSLTLADDSTTLLQIASLSAYDHLDIAGTLTAGGDLQVVFLDGFDVVEGNSFTLFNAAGGIDGAFTDVSLPELTVGLSWDLTGLYSDGRILVAASAIPEPAAWALMFGGAALVIAVRRRRRLGRG